ncbi:MAG: cupin, partial [Deltaproteobacteria bacterium]|nr:cupin [Deltaproteobacteria bacterium]
MSERRHPNVVNVAEAESMEMSEGSKFGARIRGLGRSAGAVQLGGNLVEVAPGKSAFPCHYHCAIEEAL